MPYVTDRPRPVPGLAFFGRGLGGEERIVDAVEVFRRNAGAGVSDADLTQSPLRVRTVQRAALAGMASRAFRNRFRNTCCSLPALPWISGRCPS